MPEKLLVNPAGAIKKITNNDSISFASYYEKSNSINENKVRSPLEVVIFLYYDIRSAFSGDAVETASENVISKASV